MKSLEKILVQIVSILLILYAAIVLLFSLPFMQSKLAGWTADILSKQIKSKVEIGNINIGLLNKIIINDLIIYEPSGKQFASIARVSANVNPSLLLAGKISIGTAQLFGVKAKLYKETPDSTPNYQFLIDAFQSEQKDESTEIDLSIGSLLMRHADISYDILSEKQKDNGIDLNHLYMRDGGMNLVLKCFTNDSLNASIRHLHVKEQNSGFVIKNAQLYFAGNNHNATLSDFTLSLPHSDIHVDSLNVNYDNLSKLHKFHFTSTPISGHITLCDLQSLNPNFESLTEPIDFNIAASGDEKDMNVKVMLDGRNNILKLNASAKLANVFENKARHLYTTINTLHIESTYIQELTEAFISDHSADSIIAATKEINYKGKIERDADGTIFSEGIINTAIGDADYNITYYSDNYIIGEINGDSIDVGILLNDKNFGTSSFSVDITTNISDKSKIPAGKIVGNIYNINYNGYNYRNIEVDATSTSSQIDGKVNVGDENLKLDANIVYSDTNTKGIKMQLMLEHLNPHRLNLTSNNIGETLSLNADVDLAGVDYGHLFGYININDIQLATPYERFAMNNMSIKAERLGEKRNLYTINSDVVEGHIEGNTNIIDIVTDVTNQLAIHLPITVKPKNAADSDFTYKFTITDAPIIHHFTDIDYAINSPIHIDGSLNSLQNRMAMRLFAPKLSYEGKNYNDVNIECHSTDNNMNVKATAHSLQPGNIYNDIPPTNTSLNVAADIHDNTIDGNINLGIQGANNISLLLRPTIHMADSLGSMKTTIALHRSEAIINDTTWTVAPSSISLYKNNIRCNGVEFANNNSSLTINGRVSASPSDSIVAKLKNLEIKYFLSLVDFDAVRFAGRASGSITAKKLFGNNTPDLKASLQVADLSIQEGVLGDANIQAKWDKAVDGISIDGRIVDLYQVQDALTGNDKNMTGVTMVNGWVSPAKNDIRLDINTLNTNASFIHGFLGGVFKEVSGYVSGPISVIGPLNDINIVGDAVPNMNLRLRATNVPYHIEGDTIHLRPYRFDFPNISIYDRFGNRSIVTGQVTHRNMKNFTYNFNADLNETLVYDETQFNSDKFLATVFADGYLSIDGSDGHPLYVNASVTPTQGSVFAYDAATPDAITGNTFIEYRDRDSLIATIQQNQTVSVPNPEIYNDSLAIINEAKKNYDSDIFINFDINLTPACEVKLRMNNTEDGYIQTFGDAKLSAQWYNKGSFQLFGKYDINGGAYRLYLQDIIFRDLALQPGSSVEFNGNPFNANIHLICHHTINSVPLSDLTSTTAFSQNNKVKVICILDITGKLGNMDFKFGMDMPTVSEESKQLVNSIINSEEEMNTQMIYLLGFGRFYPSEYARANGNSSNQAVNSLLSSTLSGQLNQMLSSMIGNNSNWNFGSSLTTGEQGWNDLDVEGILSGRLLDERLLIDGNFGYRDNALTQRANFIGDFEVKWRITPTGNLYVKAYNQTNDRYFTKATLNTQGIGLSWQHDFEFIRQRMNNKETTTPQKRRKKKKHNI